MKVALKLKNPLTEFFEDLSFGGCRKYGYCEKTAFDNLKHKSDFIL